MGKQLGFDYYYGIEAEQFSFYRVPRLLIKDKRFEDLSSDAKLLYGLMLDRMSLSMKNGWLDEENKVYIYYTVEEIMKDLSCARGTAGKIIAELDSKKGIGLIEKKRQGLGRPDMIYVKNFATVGQEKEDTDESEDDVPNDSSGENSDKSNMSNYTKTETSDTEIQKESNYQSTDILDEHMQNDRTETTEQVHLDICKEKTLESSSSECMKFEFPEVQNLDFREWEGHSLYAQTEYTDDVLPYMDEFTEEEMEIMRELGIANPKQPIKEQIHLYEKQETTECVYSQMPYEKEKEAKNQYVSMQNGDFSRSSEIELPEVQNLDFKKFKSWISRNPKVELAEIQDLAPNYTNTSYNNNSYTNVSYNNPIHLIYPKDESNDGCDRLDNFSDYVSLIKKNLEYDLFMQDKTWKDRELYEELFGIICDVVCVKRKSVRVAGENYPYELVKSKFLKLNSSHLTYVMDCMRKTVTKIGNIKSYMITALYNAGNTISHYYQQAVQHDMYGGGWQEAGIV